MRRTWKSWAKSILFWVLQVRLLVHWEAVLKVFIMPESVQLQATTDTFPICSEQRRTPRAKASRRTSSPISEKAFMMSVWVSETWRSAQQPEVRPLYWRVTLRTRRRRQLLTGVRLSVSRQHMARLQAYWTMLQTKSVSTKRRSLRLIA